jgi:hypothetical protein
VFSSNCHRPSLVEFLFSHLHLVARLREESQNRAAMHFWMHAAGATRNIRLDSVYCDSGVIQSALGTFRNCVGCCVSDVVRNRFVICVGLLCGCRPIHVSSLHGYLETVSRQSRDIYSISLNVSSSISFRSRGYEFRVSSRSRPKSLADITEINGLNVIFRDELVAIQSSDAHYEYSFYRSINRYRYA